AVSPAAAAAFAPAAGARVSVAAAAEHAVRGLVVLAQQHVHPVVAPAYVPPASVVRVPVAVPVAAVAVVAVAAVAGVAVAQRDVLHVVPDHDLAAAQHAAVALVALAVAPEPVFFEQPAAAVVHRVLCARHAPRTSVPSHDPARCLHASASPDRDGTMVTAASCS